MPIELHPVVGRLLRVLSPIEPTRRLDVMAGVTNHVRPAARGPGQGGLEEHQLGDVVSFNWAPARKAGDARADWCGSGG
jgi:hypothetical protein